MVITAAAALLSLPNYRVAEWWHLSDEGERACVCWAAISQSCEGNEATLFSGEDTWGCQGLGHAMERILYTFAAAWYAKATAYRPLLPARQLSRADEVKLHRLRLGYRTLEELRDDFESRQCDHCGHLARHPLRHYLLSCPATAQLRQQIGGPEDDEDRAALVLRRALEDLPRLLVVVRSAPPYR
ncbi:hypothetical protein GWK47_040606 [Chionoecetes opilio]|uniref:Uncharacterized protein n=1 Tax=Chionoecetes opilio TaxID=41210 RepID=A0A8J4YJM4_CHIOP|nr:hypothetical protein GWK47_040606 [Chionoecetes opilio]